MNPPDSNPKLKIEDQRGSLNIPVYTGTESGVSFIARGQRVELGERLQFTAADAEIPKEFGSADLGLSWNKEDLAGNRVGVSATYGRAGTQLLSDGSLPVLAANLIVERKKLDHSWFYFLSYSNNRTVLNNIPLPGIAYGFRGETYNGVFGIPFAFLMWRPGLFALSAGVSPFGASLDTGLRVIGPLQIFASGGWSPRSYQNLIKGSEDRLIFDKKDLGGGLRVTFGPVASVSVGYFHNFDRRLLLGESLNDEDAEKIEITDSDGLQVKARLAFH